MPSPHIHRTRPPAKSSTRDERRVTSFSLRVEVLDRLRAMSVRDDLSQAQIISRLVMSAP